MLWNSSCVFLLTCSGSFCSRELKRLGCQQFVERRGLSVCEGLGLESGLHVRGGVCEARCTNVDPPGRSFAGGGEVLQPVELEGSGPLGPASTSVRSLRRSRPRSPPPPPEDELPRGEARVPGGVRHGALTVETSGAGPEGGALVEQQGKPALP
jgi:hypothetical protein